MRTGPRWPRPRWPRWSSPRTLAPRQRAARQPRAGPPAEAGRRWGSFDSELGPVAIHGTSGPQQVFSPDDLFRLEVGFEHLDGPREASLELTLRTEEGTTVWVSTVELSAGGPRGTARLELPRLGLGDGNYLVDLALTTDRGQNVRDVQRGLHGFAVRAGSQTGLIAPVYAWAERTSGP